jgi:uncharacterized damage-inducible protein DinB
MFATIEAFTAEWESESGLTDRVLSGLTDDSLGQAIAADRRTLGDLAWHLATSLRFMTALGLDFDGGADHAPGNAAGIAEEYRRISSAVLQAVRTQWNDGSLEEAQTIMGEQWRNGDSLRFTLMHQAHHRGQMTVLMRQAGLRPPEIYGPTYETWVDQGKTPLA